MKQNLIVAVAFHRLDAATRFVDAFAKAFGRAWMCRSQLCADVGGGTLKDETAKQLPLRYRILLSLDLNFSRCWPSVIVVSSASKSVSLIVSQVVAGNPMSAIFTEADIRAATCITSLAHLRSPRDQSNLRLNIQTVESILVH